MVHKLNQVALQVGLLIVLIIGKGLDNVVDKFFEGLRANLVFITTRVQGFQELLHVALALQVSIGLENKRQSLYEDLLAVRQHFLLQLRVEHELLQDSNSSLTKVSVAQRNQEVVLHLTHDLEPGIQVLFSELLLDGGIKDLDVSLLKVVKTLL